MKLTAIILIICVTATLAAESSIPTEHPRSPEQNEELPFIEEADASAPRLGSDDFLIEAISIGPSLMFFAEHAKISISIPTLDFSITTNFNASYFGFSLGVYSFAGESHFHLAQSFFAGGGVGDVNSDFDISGGVNLPQTSVSLDASQVDTNFLMMYALMPGLSFYPSERSVVNFSLGVNFLYFDFAANGGETTTYSMGFPAQLSVGTVIGKGLWLDGGFMVMVNPLIISHDSSTQSLGTPELDTSRWDIRIEEHYYLGLTLFIRLGGILLYGPAKPSPQEEQAPT